MSIESQGFLVSYGFIALMVLIGCVMVLEDDSRLKAYGRRSKLTDRERVWVGRAGLAAPLWPITALAVVVSLVIYLTKTLVMAARGRE